MSELKELVKALGYVGGEIHEIAKDGLGLEDLASIKDLIEHRELLIKGFDIKGDFKEHLEGLGVEELVALLMELKAGYDLGKK